MKSNGLLKWFMIPLVLLAVFVAVKLWSSSKEHAAKSNQDTAIRLSPAEMKALGVEGDTPRDTLATLVAQLKQLRQELQSAVSDNKQQKSENERLRQRENGVDQRIQATFDSERDSLEKDRAEASTDRQQTQTLVQELRSRLAGIKGSHAHADVPVGLGLDEDEAETSEAPLKWTEPLDTLTSKNGKTGLPPPGLAKADADTRTSFDLAIDHAPESPEPSGNAPEEPVAKAADSAKPVYTVPASATLMGSVAMTALIGRVPIDGTVHDAFPFKVLIGADNLTANGIEIPDVAGAVVSGTASGDWTLSCVRGQIRSVTFVFTDGTIRTLPSSSTPSRDSANTLQNGLGWISDPYGIPCVAGERRSNAEQYLTSQMLITAAGAGAASLIKSDNANTAFVAGTNGNVLGTVGISGSEAMGRILAGGVQEMSQWVNKLYGQAFAAVYVKPGAPVAVHIEQPLDIDYDTKGRKVDHRKGGFHDPDLD